MHRSEVESLYEKYGPALMAYACAILRHRSEAEDVLQQVFLNLMKVSIHSPDNPKPYLYRAVRNAAQNARRIVLREVQLEPSGPWFWSDQNRTVEVFELQASLLQIPDDQREIIVMKIWGDLTFDEIGQVAGISPNTAASRYRYGLSKLRAVLSPKEAVSHAKE